MKRLYFFFITIIIPFLVYSSTSCDYSRGYSYSNCQNCKTYDVDYCCYLSFSGYHIHLVYLIIIAIQ